MGHPSAPDHDHHRSFWWGHQNIAGVNFWEERSTTPLLAVPQIRQEAWVHYQDGDEEAGIVVKIGWFDAHKVRLMVQDLIVVYRPLAGDEGWLELQTKFTPTLEELKIARTNFGFLGLRVAASMSKHFGDGTITASHGGVNEKAIFAKPAKWVDYSGPITAKAHEGITWFDHPSNCGDTPTSWHVREDGWMSAAHNLREGLSLTKDKPLNLRYALHIHAKSVDAKSADAKEKEFAESKAWEVVSATRPWRVTLRRKS
jgi:hypothetical protein